MRGRYWLLLLLLSPVVLARAEDPETKSPAGAEEAKPPKAKREIRLAVIVNAKNPITKVSFGQLRAYLKMSRQFWPNRKRCDLYLPPHTTDAYAILLDKVYKTTHKKLQKYWVRKLFSGDIPAKPSYAPSAAAAVSLIKKYEGALTVLPADLVPKGVKVLLIDGKKPGDDKYPLVGLPRAKKK